MEIISAYARNLCATYQTGLRSSNDGYSEIFLKGCKQQRQREKK